jgi:hypothetical protein
VADRQDTGFAVRNSGPGLRLKSALENHEGAKFYKAPRLSIICFRCFAYLNNQIHNFYIAFMANI